MASCKSYQSQFLGFLRGVAEISLLLGCCAASLWCWFPTFRDKVMVSFFMGREVFSLKFFDLWRWHQYVVSRLQAPNLQWRRATPPKNGEFISDLEAVLWKTSARSLCCENYTKDRNWRTASNVKSKRLIKSTSWSWCKMECWGHCFKVQKRLCKFVIRERKDAIYLAQSDVRYNSNKRNVGFWSAKSY